MKASISAARSSSIVIVTRCMVSTIDGRGCRLTDARLASSAKGPHLPLAESCTDGAGRRAGWLRLARLALRGERLKQAAIALDRLVHMETLLDFPDARGDRLHHRHAQFAFQRRNQRK